MEFDIELYMKAEEAINTASTQTSGISSAISKVISIEKPKTIDASSLVAYLSQFNTEFSSNMDSFKNLFSQWKASVLNFYQQQSSFEDQYEDLIKQIQEYNVSQNFLGLVNLPFIYGAVDKKLDGIQATKEELIAQAKELELMMKWADIETPNVPGYLARTGATIGKFAVSLLEGVGKLGEGIVDFLSILGTAALTTKTAVIDGLSWASSKLFGTEYESLTVKMWENTKASVAKDHVTGWFDSFYEKTKVGQYLDENSFYSDTVRSVGVGVGYIGGIIALSVLTCGAAGLTAATPVASLTSGGLSFGTAAATAVTTATQAGAASIVLTTQGVIAGGIAAAAGIGKNTGAAWADGATTIDGLKYGVATDQYEGMVVWLLII